MSSRAAPWRSKPSQALQDLLSRMNPSNSNSSNLFLLQRLGPAGFLVGQDQEQQSGVVKHKVMLGNLPTCTCGDDAGHEPCVHLVFVMLRVLRILANNPLVWQSALTDHELQQVLTGHHSRTNRRSTNSSTRAGLGGSSASCRLSSGSVQRKEVDEDEPCPICYEPLAEMDLAWLVYCSSGCGKNMHGKCMRVWSQHQTKTLHQELTCPLCRCPWGPLSWTPPSPSHAKAHNKTSSSSLSSSSSTNDAQQPLHRGVKCFGCHQSPIAGIRYRCLVCPSYDLCSACFNAGQHLHHSFVARQTPAGQEGLADRQLQASLRCSSVAHSNVGGNAAGQASLHSSGLQLPQQASQTRSSSSSSLVAVQQHQQQVAGQQLHAEGHQQLMLLPAGGAPAVVTQQFAIDAAPAVPWQQLGKSQHLFSCRWGSSSNNASPSRAKAHTGRLSACSSDSSAEQALLSIGGLALGSSAANAASNEPKHVTDHGSNGSTRQAGKQAPHAPPASAPNTLDQSMQINSLLGGAAGMSQTGLQLQALQGAGQGSAGHTERQIRPKAAISCRASGQAGMQLELPIQGKGVTAAHDAAAMVDITRAAQSGNSRTIKPASSVNKCASIGTYFKGDDSIPCQLLSIDGSAC